MVNMFRQEGSPEWPDLATTPPLAVPLMCVNGTVFMCPDMSLPRASLSWGKYGH